MEKHETALGEPRLDREEAYWSEKLANPTEPVGLPLDRPRSAVAGFRPGHVDIPLGEEVQKGLIQLCGGNDTLLLVAFVAVVKACLHRTTGAEDIVVGTTIHRRYAELASLNKVLPLRDRVRGDSALRDLLRGVKDTLSQAYVHQKLSFDRMRKLLAAARPDPVGPLFRVAVLLEQINDLGSLWHLHPDVTLIVSRTDGEVRCWIEHNAELLHAASVQAFGEACAYIASALVADPESRIEELALLTPEQERELLLERNATAREFPGCTIHELFEREAGRSSGKTALVADYLELSYGELNRRANQLAHYLRHLGLGPGGRVGLLLDHSFETVVGILAVLKAGGAYLPLDPASPAERLAFMLSDSGIAVLLTQEHLAGRCGACRAPILRLDADRQLFAHESGDDPEAGVAPRDLAYIIYTSGSTGRPKGVMIPHSALVNYIWWSKDIYLQGEELAFPLYSSLAFDLTVTSIFIPLVTGNRLVLYNSEKGRMPVLEVLRDNRVGILKLTPSHLSLIKDRDNRGSRIRRLIVGGEALESELARQVCASFGGEIEIFNEYGPTEATVGCMIHRFDPERDDRAFVPIGRAAANTRIYILGEDLRPVGLNASGELYIAGAGLAQGYWGRDDLTTESFVSDPFHPGDRMYRTGDLARWLPEGGIDYIGRRDGQVKFLGHRIELNEIRWALNQHARVRDSVVRATRDEKGNPVLVAYYVSREDLDSEELRSFLSSHIAEETMPSFFVHLQRLPLTLNGKVNYEALPSLEEAKKRLKRDLVAPRSVTEQLLAGVFNEVLGLREVGVHESFFALGGHSLLATQVASRVRDLLHLDLPLRTLFEAPTVADLAVKVDELRMQGHGLAAPPLVRARRDGELPLSFAQQRLWFIHRLEPASPAYNIPAAVRLNGRLDRRALRAALCGVAARHETLRTTFGDLVGEPVQRIAPPVPVAVPLIDLVGLPDAALEAETRRLIAEEERRPFDLAQGPLLRVELLRLDEEEHALLLTLHHIISDGWSMGVLIRELATLYGAHVEDRPSPLPPLTVQYADFALWQRQWMSGQVLDGQLRYWRERLAGAPQVLEVPADRPRPAVASGRGGLRSSHLSIEIAGSLAALAQREGATLFMVALAAWNALLSRLTGQNDLVVGTPIANRSRSEVEALIGLFVNTLALRTELPPDLDFLALVRRTREATLGALAHQDLPFERLVEELAPERSLAHTPLFQVMLAVQNASLETLDLPGLTLHPLRAEMTTAKLDLSLTLGETPAGLAASLEFSRDLFDAATVDRLLGHLETLLAAALEDPGRRVVDLPLLREAERHQLLAAGRAAAAPADLQSCLHGLFEAQARREPDAVAAICGGRSLSYGELDSRAARLAHRLRRLGVGPEVPVGVCFASSLELVVALLAALKAGGAYLPLDPAYPRERLAFLLQDSGAPVVLTLERLARVLPDEAPHVVCLEAPGEDAETTAPDLAPGLSNLAYLIYTSGSTGLPKAVAVEHGAASAHMRSMAAFFGLGRGDRVLQLASPSFDTSLEQILPALTSGATVVLHGPELWEPSSLLGRIAELGLTVVDLPTAYWQEWVSQCEGHDLPAGLRLRAVSLGGEAMSPEAARLWWRTPLAGIPLFNVYGPTEAVVSATALEVDGAAAASDAVGIGRPLTGHEAFVLDARGELSPVGAPGELHLGGALLARGYRGRPDLTAERFVPDPFAAPGASQGARLYRTGDRVRWRPDGALEFLGRADEQVKVRGYRVEPGEIEAALLALPEVRAAAVVAQGMVSGGVRLMACVVAAEGCEPSLATLRERLRERLPEYMLPATWAVLPALPLTPNGKVDRRALRRIEPDAAPAGSEGLRSLRTPLEEVIAGIWGDLLGSEVTGSEESFFDLGGHSLLATRVVSRLRATFGIEVPLRALFEAPTVAGLARAVEAAMRPGTAAALPPLGRAPQGEPPPLSFAQQRLWFLDQLEPGSSAYNLPVAMRWLGALRLPVLAASLREVLARHEALRTTFGESHRGPVQKIGPCPPQIVLSQVDLSGIPELRREAEARRLVREEEQRPFDLRNGPLVRFALLRLRAEEHIVLFTLHHIVGDAWSIGLLTRELQALYPAFAAGLPSPLPPLALQYGDFARWQRDWLEGEALETLLAYWRQALAGAPPRLELPADRPRPSLPSGSGGLLPIRLDAALATALAVLARRQGATLFMTLLAAWQTFLYRMTGQADLVVGSPIANRTRAEVEDLIGFFVNVLPLRTDLAGDPFFPELIARVREVTLSAYVHQDLPFDRLVEEMAPERALSRTPLFQVVFALQNAPAASLQLSGLTLVPLALAGGTAKFDLTLSLVEGRPGLGGALEFSRDLFDPATAARFASHFETLLAAMALDPAQRIEELPLLGPAERSQLLLEWNQTAADYPRDATLPELFEAQVLRTPEAIAVVYGDEELTYRDLSRRADRVARRLRACGVGPEALVGLCAERSADLVTGMLGILKAGGAYVPLDPSYPRERLALMLEDAGAPVVLTQERGAAALPPGKAVLLLLDEAVRDEGLEYQGGRPAPAGATTAESLAYVMYTSGSTGKPKGVAVSHRAIVRLVRGTDYAQLEPADRIAQVASSSFDAATFEIWGALLNGACLVGIESPVALSPGALATRIAEQRISALFLTTALFQQIARETPEAFRPLRHLLFGGEVVEPRWVREILEKGAPERLLHVYGPTESTTFSSWHLVEQIPERATSVPIGRPIRNTRAHVLDGYLRPVPVGVIGDLYLGGDGLARGYHNRPDLTAERFVPDTSGYEPGGRLYQTGDRARHLADGTIDFLGRLDHQVKLRGFRIELGEIEAALTELPAVRQALLVVWPGAGGSTDRRLVAYVVGETASEELRRYLEARLPSFMIPSAFVTLPSFPLTTNGKVDRRALPEPEWGSRETEGVYAPPRTPTEELLADLWGEVLGVARAGIHDDFFELGGHSLLATRLASRIRAVFSVELPLRELFQAPTVGSLAPVVEALREEVPGLVAAPPLLPVPRTGEMPLSFAQERLWVLDQLEAGSPAYNIPLAMRLTGRLISGALAAGIAEIVRRHESLRTVFPVAASGPVQVIVAPESSALPQVDLSGLCAEAREREMCRLLDEDARQSFDLARGPLFRPRLLRLASEEHVVLATLHHIVADGWSLDVLVRELAALYQAFCAGSPPPLADLSLQYADFAVWQRSWLSGETLDREIGHWRQRLAGAPATLGLLGDRPRQGSSRGAEERLILPEGLCTALRVVARREAVTPFMLFLAAFQALLSRQTGETDVCVGTPIAGRNRLETEGLIGFFVNTLVLRGELAGDPDVRSMLLRTREAALDAYSHQDLPFEKLVEELSPERSLSQAPLFQVMFALQNAPRGEVRLPGLTLSPLAADNPTTKFDLSLSMIERGGRYLGVLTYAVDLFEPATVRRLLAHLEALLECFGRCAQAGPVPHLSELALLSPAELHQIHVEWNSGLAWQALPAPEVHGLHELFEHQVERAPESIAVSFAGTLWTYQELNRRSNRLAHRLRRAGAGPGGRVAICAERSPAMVAMVLAVLKSGAAYVALDPEHPRARLEQILADCSPGWLLTQERLLVRLPELAGEVLRVESEWDEAPGAGEWEGNPAPLASAQDLAYIVYTSGSTGRPKGILAPHGGAARYLSWLVRAYDLSGQDIALQLAPLSFDASVRDTLAPLAVGAQVVVVPSEVARDPAALVLRIVESGVTCLPSVVPSVLRRLAEEASAGQAYTASLRLVLVSGETLFGSDCDKVREAFGSQVRIVNQYGPTECTMTSTHHAVTFREGERAGVGIGRPNANARISVLDRSLRPVPIGVPGEIFLGGAGLAHGYLGQPDRTAEAFVPDPLQPGGSGGERVYWTGDLGRWLSDGTLQFLGRRDHQVKLRGVRVEPGEIESLLREHPAIRDAAVVAHEPAVGEVSLCAYLVASGGLEPGAPRRFLAHRLPTSLIPSFFVTVDELPRTANGKLDRLRLPAPAPGAASHGEAPRTVTEEILTGIWQEVLRTEDLGVRESFFDRGGHSLLATRMLSRVRQVFGVDLALRSVFESPTVSSLALLVDEEKRKEHGLQIPPFEPMAARVEAPLSFSQQRLWFMDQMEPGNPFYNIADAFVLDGRLDPAALEQAFAEVVRRQGVLRTVFASQGDQPVQRVQPPAPVTLPIADLSTLGEAVQQDEARRLVVQEARAPFELARGPLFRIRLLRLGESRHVFLVTLHHIITDGWSIGVLIRELIKLYESFSRCESSPLEDLPLQYTDFAVWQQQWMRGETLENQLAYWRRQLADVPAVTRLPTDRPRPAVQSYRGGRQSFELAAEPYQRLRELSQREGVSLFMAVLAAYQAFLSSCAGEEVVVVGSPVSYRNWVEVEGLIGFFASTLLFRGDISGNPSFRELLGRVRKTALDAFAHEHVPFDKLVNELRPERQLGYNPLFQVGFTFQTVVEASLQRSDLLVRPFGFELETTQIDLNLTVVDTGAKLVGDLQFSRDLFEEITVDLMREQLQELMRKVGSDPEIRMNDLRPLLTEVSRRRLGALKLKRELGQTTAPSLRSGRRQAVVVTGK